MKEQIKAIIYKYTYHGGTDGVPMTIDVEKIAEEIDKLYHSEDKLDKIDKQGGWICPRCGKVHSWLSTECNCLPIGTWSANTTEPIKCDVCGCHPAVIITTPFGTFCQEHARYF